MAKIAFFAVDNEEKIEYLKKNLEEHTLCFFDYDLDEDNIPQDVTDAEVISVFVGCKANQKVIDSFPNLKLIAARSTGFDNVDTEYAKSKNIAVVNVPEYGSRTVAEFAFALILTLSRNLYPAINRLKTSSNYKYEGLRGFDLFEKTIGVIGTGKIGANLIRMAKGFGMKVVAYDLYPNDNLKQELGFEYMSLEDLLKTSDVITVHAPATKETYHLINKDNVNLIKKGAILINTARGQITETEAMFNALGNGNLAGIGLDVLEGENDLKEEAELLRDGKLAPDKMKEILQDHILMKDSRVMITPHMAFYTKEAEEAILKSTVDNILGYASGQVVNRVNG